MTDFAPITTLTFDCYGTLIDWEAGILAALRPLADRSPKPPSDDALLAAFGEIERRVEEGPHIPYRAVLARVTRELSTRFHFPLGPNEGAALAESLPNWPAFPDTAAALRRLRTRYRLGIISNIDDDLLQETLRRASLEVDWAVTAQQCRSYKPSTNNFTTALAAQSLKPHQILHIASSIGHDIAPASSLGIDTVHLHRRAGRDGPGANGPGIARPTHTAPNFESLLGLLRL